MPNCVIIIATDSFICSYSLFSSIAVVISKVSIEYSNCKERSNCRT